MQLTSDLRRAYGSLDTSEVFPVAVVGEVLPQGITPDSARLALGPVLDRILATHWFQGQDAAGHPFHAQTLDFRLNDGSTYTVALVFKEGVLVAVDTPYYLGPVTPLPGESLPVSTVKGAS
jgi:hypothetical protein